MPTQIPCLWFDREAEQAARHYTAIFPNSEILSVSRYGPDRPEREREVMTVEFSLDGQSYVALNGGPQFPFTEAVSFQIQCADQAEVDHYWNRLTDDGEQGPCGWLKDRFGLSWQVVPVRLFELVGDPDPERSQRATQAMLTMKKIIIADLERAADAAPAPRDAPAEAPAEAPPDASAEAPPDAPAEVPRDAPPPSPSRAVP